MRAFRPGVGAGTEGLRYRYRRASGSIAAVVSAARNLWARNSAMVLVDGVEVATFRSDHSYQDGRHPAEVKFETDPKQDVLRRDFTINGLLLDPA